jgi:hypothetical protein
MVATRYCISFIQKYPYLGLNTSQISSHLKHLKSTTPKNSDHEIHIFQQKKPKIIENIVHPNVSFNSLIVPPIVKCMKLEKMSIFKKMMSIK